MGWDGKFRSLQPKPRARCSPGRPGRPGRPDADWFSVFCLFSGAPLLGGGGAGGRRERVSLAGCGRVPPAWGPRCVAGQRPGGDCAGYYPAPTAPSPRGYFVPRVSRASRVGRVGLCTGRTLPAPPLTRRPPPRRQEAGAGLRSRPPASVRVSAPPAARLGGARDAPGRCPVGDVQPGAGALTAAGGLEPGV